METRVPKAADTLLSNSKGAAGRKSTLRAKLEQTGAPLRGLGTAEEAATESQDRDHGAQATTAAEEDERGRQRPKTPEPHAGRESGSPSHTGPSQT